MKKEYFFKKCVLYGVGEVAIVKEAFGSPSTTLYLKAY